MGMFDWISCDYPLPNEPPEFCRKPGYQFQTKDLGCTMAEYRITEAGRLVLVRRGWCDHEEPPVADIDQNIHGEVEFYSSNITGSGPGLYTKNGEDAESVDYKAIFIHGQLHSILETERTKKLALPSSRQGVHTFRRSITDAEKAERKRREEELLVGRTVYRRRFISLEEHAYEPIRIVFETDRQWCGILEDGLMELIDRRLRDQMIFDSPEAGQAMDQDRKEEWNRGKEEYDRLLKERQCSQT